MRSRLFPLLALLFLCLFSADAQIVNEQESAITLNERTADLSLVIDNQDRPAMDAIIDIELLDGESKVCAHAVKTVRLKEGKAAYDITLPMGELMKTAGSEIAWYRLRYRVGNTAGIVSLSQIIRDIFELRVIGTSQLFAGMTHRSRVFAVNPYTNAPVSGVGIEGKAILELRGEDRKLELKAFAESDPDGYATLEFQIPVNARLDDDGELIVTGRKNGILREASEDLQQMKNDMQFLMMTDKPIYQPEQTFNIRGILFKGVEATIVPAGTEIEFTIEDEDETPLYREKVKTSDFGIAAISWKIPDGAKLGTYRVRVRDDENEILGNKRFRVSRYDLPNFAVTATPDKAFYLPNEQQARIEVRADYLFGKPVTKGKVRIVRETRREWDWKTQKYSIDEGDSEEGGTDQNGKFTATFSLAEAHEELKEEDWDKLEDLHFTAYYTDLTTNKTEQRRFDVRVTREPIHVYLIGDHNSRNPGLPVTSYISTFYADGSPAECDVEIKASEEDAEKYRPVERIKTNSHGAGKFLLKHPAHVEDDEDIDLRIIARDKTGRRGTSESDIDFTHDDKIRIETAKTIYKPGEAVKIKVNSTQKAGKAYVDVVKEWSVIDSHAIDMKNGAGELTVPYKPGFEGELKIAVYMEEEDDDDELIYSSRGIIYASPNNLKVETSPDKQQYKPGEDATVRFSVTDSIGQAVQSALGAVVFDKAVEERARTDESFGRTFGDFEGRLGYGKSFGTWNIKDINELDLSKPVSDDIQLVAEVMLYNAYYYPNIFRSRKYDTDAKVVYARHFKEQFANIEGVLDRAHKANFDHPTDDASLNRILGAAGTSLNSLRDPWEQPYRPVFGIEKTHNTVRFISTGADKKIDTADDLAASSLAFTYFTPTGNSIDKAVTEYNARTGDHIRNAAVLLKEMGIRELRDRYGRPYNIIFESAGRYYVIRIRSSGPDGIPSPYDWLDDFDVWTNRSDYFARVEKSIKKLLDEAAPYPRDEESFKKLLKKGGIDIDTMRDGNGEKVYVNKKEYQRYWDKTTVEDVAVFGKEGKTTRTVVTPVTQQVITFEIRSSSRDRKRDSYDDVTLGWFLRVITEQSKDDPAPKVMFLPSSFTAGGTIAGMITDATGAAVPTATITATNGDTRQESVTTTNGDGKYMIANLPAAKYTVKADATGFQTMVYTDVDVAANSTINLNMSLNAGTVSETVTVTGSAEVSSTMNSSSSVIGARQIKDLPINARRSLDLVSVTPGEPGTNEQKSTPRLREYFPETLLWNPEIITGPDGKAEMKFRMADNITTWKLYTIASTKDGKLGVAEKEITAFQSFFADLDPPKFLTNGDEISLPVQVRNYTETKQKVDVTMAGAEWFRFLGPDKAQIDVEKNGSKNALFGFKATEVVKDAKQRVTALAQTESDAIEKPVTVRPDGEEIVKTETGVFRGTTGFDVNFPANALPKTPRADLKIYPNLFAHVSESVEGLLQRPYGCGEQTISSTYPNVMVLKFVKEDNSLRRKAQKYLNQGYERLIGYQVADGGFSYWGGKDSPDVALTAYALRFLNDAKDLVAVDPEVVRKAEEWLIKQQRPDGSWTKKYYYETTEDTTRSKLFTSYIARTLAIFKERNSEPVRKALAYLKARNAEINDPHSLALYGLASLEVGDLDTAGLIARKLEKLGIAEGTWLYWNLEANTPFYGWGLTGRIETTALVVQLLIREEQSRIKGETAANPAITKGTGFLLRNKDRYGVWYSTQTTINVLDALLAALAPKKDGGAPETLQILVNGSPVQEITVPADQITPIELKLPLETATNKIEIKVPAESMLMAQIVATHYIDWRDSESTGRTANQSRTLKLDYSCDKASAAIMQEVTCAVNAERVGFQGYGMLLAEIGTPPGADVSRESLQRAMDADSSISRYDILPDRIVVYMWARAGGTKFNFKFKPRYGINALTPASIAYDYYNPESRAVAAPVRFVVK